MAAQAVPTDGTFPCPRCGFTFRFGNVSSGLAYRCSGCEYMMALTTVAPTNTLSSGVSAGGTALPVASGGASFTSGMFILIDTGTLAEVTQATATGSGTSIPVGALSKGHLSAVAIGQLHVAPFFSNIQASQPASPWPALQPNTF